MHTKTFILAGIALIGSGISSAISGPCTVEIDGLTKTLASKDAGSGPTVGATGQANAPTGSSAQHPQPRSWVRRPRARQLLRKTFVAKPGASRLLRSRERPEQPAGATRALDRRGKEAECMDSVRQAKELAGSR
jgi:hypothetical protein